MTEPDEPAGGSPFRPERFRKFDESDDAPFHAELLKPEDHIRNLMSSWISHPPGGYQPAKAARDHNHVRLVGAYFHHSGEFEPAQWHEHKQSGAAPLCIVQARTATRT